MCLDEIEQRLSDSIHELRREAREEASSPRYMRERPLPGKGALDHPAALLWFKGTDFAQTDIIHVS
jgi:hypothetical protein